MTTALAMYRKCDPSQMTQSVRYSRIIRNCPLALAYPKAGQECVIPVIDVSSVSGALLVSQTEVKK